MPPTLRLARALLAAAAVTFTAADAWALDPGRRITQYLRDHWQTEQGLPQNGVGAIQRTRDGYLWVGTEEGLARFDGVKFTVFDRRNVNALYEDEHGRLWAGTSRGLSVLDRGVFRDVGNRELSIASLLPDQRGRLWVGTFGDGLHRVDPASLAMTKPATNVPGKRVRSLALSGGALFAATEAGLTMLRGDAAVRTFTRSDGLLDDNLFALLPADDGALWVGSDGGLQRLRGDRFETIDTPLQRLRALGRDAEGNLWIGTQGQGLGRLTGGKLEVLTTALGLSSNVVVALSEDVERNLWAGTSGGGLVRLRDGKVATWTTADGVPAETVFTLFEDRGGAVWIGTRGGGVARLAGGRIDVWSTKNGLPSDDVVSVTEWNGEIWVGTYGGGVTRLRDGKVAGRLGVPDGLASDIIYALHATRSGAVYIGTGGAGLDVFDGGKVTHFPETNGRYVQALYEAPDGTVWVGTNEGLLRIRDGVVRSWTTSDGLPYKSVISIAGDGDALWIGTPGGGLARFRNDRFAAVDTRHGLHDDMVASILHDGRGRFWFSSNHGIFSVSREELHAVADGRTARLHSTVLGAADGMTSAECYGGSYPPAWRGRDGRLWFATIRGAAVVDPAKQRAAGFVPPVVVESIRADGKLVRGGEELPAGTERIVISYSGLALANPASVTYRYMLEGFDPGWVEAGSARDARYTRVPHGRYTFRVMARGDNGVWSPVAAAPSFEVLPHFWETWWFRLLALLALIGIAVAAHRIRVWRLEARQRELEELVQVRTRELAAANRELDRLARVDGLTGIANRRAFDEALEKAWAEERRRGGALAVVLCDIDQFKKFNDSHGHQAGDETLRAVARALAGALRRETDLAARYGGEELVLLLPDTDAAQALTVAENALEQVRALRIPHPVSEVEPYVTMSLGIAAARPAEGGDAHALLVQADEALYRAKTTGRNRCVAA